jgi:molybdate transport system substrate-binding protein
MATRSILNELVPLIEKHIGQALTFESVGGVDAAKRVAAGEAFDVVLLASDAIDKLVASGAILATQRVEFARSPVAIAVPMGRPHPDIGAEQSVRRAIESASAIGYSTGPSGAQLLALLGRFGIADAIKARLVQAPPGVPVGHLLAHGEVDLGFQQLSELMHVGGIEVVGTLPASIEIVTVFSAGIAARATNTAAARAMLEFLKSPLAADAIIRNGMAPA